MLITTFFNEMVIGSICKDAPCRRKFPELRKTEEHIVQLSPSSRIPQLSQFKNWVQCGFIRKFSPPGSDVFYLIRPSFWLVLTFCRAYMELFLDHSKDLLPKLNFDEWLTPLSLMISWNLSDTEEIKVLKYWTVFPMWKFMSRSTKNIDSDLNPPPTVPSNPPHLPGIPFSGFLKRFVKNRTVGSDKKAAQFCWSVFQGIKRSCAIVPTSFFIQEQLGHINTLIKKVDPPSKQVLDWITETVNGIVTDRKPLFPFTETEISSSASFLSFRKTGGMHNELLSTHNSSSISMSGDKKLGFKSASGSSVFTEDFPHFSGRPGHEVKFMRTSFPGISRQDLFSEFRNSDPLINRSVMIHPLAEPLKIRIITKAHGPVTHIGRFFQKPVHTMLRNTEVFELLDHMVDSSMVYTLRNSCLKFWKVFQPELSEDDLVWTSGDFKGATDTLNIEVTRTILNVFIQYITMSSNLPSDIYVSELLDAFDSNINNIRLNYPERLFWSNLDGIATEEGKLDPSTIDNHDIAKAVREYIKITGDDFLIGTKGDRPTFLMKNGQLMGSILSFPLLCLANYSAYTLSLLRYIESNNLVPGKISHTKFQRLVWKTSPVRINGDDILFFCPKNFVRVWRDVISEFGFTLSPGKNYVNDKFLTVNSQLFIVGKSNHLTTVEKVPFLNLSLLIPEDLSNLKSIKTIDSRWNELVQGSQNPERLYNRFKTYNIDLIKNVTKNGVYNLNIPQELGGLGLQSPSASFRPKITHDQWKIAFNLLGRIKSTSVSNPKTLEFNDDVIDRLFPRIYVTDKALDERLESSVSRGYRSKYITMYWRDSQQLQPVNNNFRNPLVFGRKPNTQKTHTVFGEESPLYLRLIPGRVLHRILKETGNVANVTYYRFLRNLPTSFDADIFQSKAFRFKLVEEIYTSNSPQLPSYVEKVLKDLDNQV
jgi:hypothetical protein